MSFRACFKCLKAWYTKDTTEYNQKKDEGIICDHSHYSYSSHRKNKIPDKVEICRGVGEEWR